MPPRRRRNKPDAGRKKKLDAVAMEGRKKKLDAVAMEMFGASQSMASGKSDALDATAEEMFGDSQSTASGESDAAVEEVIAAVEEMLVVSQSTASGKPDAATAEKEMCGGGGGEREGWVMFDTDIILGKPAVKGTEASHRTSSGFAFCVSLNVAPLPALSYIYLDCEQSLTPPTAKRGGSWAVAADANHIVLCVIVPVEGQYGYYTYPWDYFVYTADIMRPTLYSLPDFPDKLPRQPGDISILSHDVGDGFTIAALKMCIDEGSTSEAEPQEVAELWLFSQCSGRRNLDGDNKWHVEKLAVPYDSEKELESFQWASDVAFSYAGKFYWADYNIGLLSYDVFEHSPKLQLVKFPVPVRKVERYSCCLDDDCPEAESFRTVGVCSGMIKFVDVDVCCCHCSHCSQTAAATVIRMWTLHMPEMKWELDAMLDVNHLWETSFKNFHLPQWVPQYPVLSLDDQNTVHFLLLGPEFVGELWMITVDMKTNSVKSCNEYYPNNEKGDDVPFFNRVLRSDVCKYLQPGCDGWKYGDETGTNASEAHSTSNVP